MRGLHGLFAAALIVLWSGLAPAQDRDEDDIVPAAGDSATSQADIAEPSNRSERAVVLEVLLVHVPESAGRDAEGAAKPEDADDAVLSRPARQAWDWATGGDAAKAGARVRRVRLTGVENNTARVQVGESSAVATGRSRSFGGRGDFQTSYEFIETGLIVSFTAAARGEKIAAEITVEETRLDPAAPADPDAEEIPTPARRVATAQGTVVLTPGEPVVLGGVESTNSGQGTTLILGRINWAE
jgi:hypothetical protein